MAQLTATVTVEKQSFVGKQGYRNLISIAIGDGSNTYGTGIAITGFQCGMPAGALHGILCELSDIGYVARYDATSAKIKLFEVDPDSTNDVPLSELDSGDTPAAMVIKAEAIGY